MKTAVAAGTPLVWVIYGSKQAVYTPDGMGRTVQADDRLENASVMPDFSCKLGDLF